MSELRLSNAHLRHRESLRELESQHERLGALLSSLTLEVGRLVSSGSLETSAEILELFADLECRLPEHFEFEERGGYLSDTLAIAPRLSKRAQQLREDHDKFATWLTKLVASARRAGTAPRNWAALAARLHDFTQALRYHELEENRLIQEALMDDEGGGG